MPTVYILNGNSNLDYSDAQRFGDVVFVTKGPLPAHDISFISGAVELALRESSPEDMLVIGSLQSLCTIAGAIFAAKHGRVNLLLYRRNRYQKFTITMEQKSNDPTSTVQSGDSAE